MIEIKERRRVGSDFRSSSLNALNIKKSATKKRNALKSNPIDNMKISFHCFSYHGIGSSDIDSEYMIAYDILYLI